MDTAVPGMAEWRPCLPSTTHYPQAGYHQIVVDTDPFSAYLRLFELPGHFQRFLNFLEFGGESRQILAQHFGGNAKPASFPITRTMVANGKRCRDALRGEEMLLVTTSEKFSLNESLRCRDVLGQQSTPLKFSSVVLNRAIDGSSAGCSVCRNRVAATRAARVLLKREFPGTDLYVARISALPWLA